MLTPHARDDEPPSWAELRRKADDLLGRYGGLAGAAEGRPDEAARLMLLTSAVRELRYELARFALAEAELRADDEPAPSRRRRAPRHASPGPRPLRAVGQAAATATAAAAAAVITLGGNPAGYITHAVAAAQPPAAARARVAPADAVPYYRPAYRPRHAGTQATTARHVAGRHRMLSAPVPPPPSPVASPTPTPTPVVATPAGVLQVAQVAVVVAGGHATLSFSASGGDVQWTASSSSPWVALSATSGTLAAGEQQILVITIVPGAPLAGTAVITLNGQDIPVTWALPAGL